MVGKPQSYMNTMSRTNAHLNAPIRSKSATPIGKTKTKKIGEQRKKEKELTLVHFCQQIKRERVSQIKRKRTFNSRDCNVLKKGRERQSDAE